MNRTFLPLVLAAALWPVTGPAQDHPTSAAALEDRREAEERYRRLATDLENVLATNARLKERVDNLTETVRALREDLSRVNTSAGARETGVREDLHRLKDKIEEVDRKRESDKTYIAEKLNDLGKTLASQPPVVVSHRPAPRVEKEKEKEPVAPAPISEKVLDYVVQKGDNLTSIVAEFNKGLKEKGYGTVSLQQVLKANPKLKGDPQKIMVGQKLLLPLPAP